MSVVVAAWLMVLVGAWVGDWDVSWTILPLLLCSLLVGALRRSRWVRQRRGRTGPPSAEEALKGYPTWW
ncbi:hypothetical protein ACFFX1_18845 [Dactylosporangium sucinum]|nr:hypothetical protein [Dactylosporangium sucinum]